MISEESLNDSIVTSERYPNAPYEHEDVLPHSVAPVPDGHVMIIAIQSSTGRCAESTFSMEDEAYKRTKPEYIRNHVRETLKKYIRGQYPGEEMA